MTTHPLLPQSRRSWLNCICNLLSLLATLVLLRTDAFAEPALPFEQVRKAAVAGGLATGTANALAHKVAATFQEQAKLSPSDSRGSDFFGTSVAISGHRALVGAIDNFDGGTGAAYVFAFNGSSWVQEAKLTAADAKAGDYFGYSVSLSGNLALVGSVKLLTLKPGAAYVYVYDGTTWTQQAKLTPPDSSDTSFGASVSLSGERALVGSPEVQDSVTPGSAYVFDSDGNNWFFTAKLTSSESAAKDSFGTSVSLSGNRALIGATGPFPASGAAYVFGFDGTNWNQQAKLTATDGKSGDNFGGAVSLAGNRALIGASDRDEEGKLDSGAAYIFSMRGGVWTEEAEIAASDTDKARHFGTSVALLGKRALVGAPGRDAGTAYLFGFDGTTWSQQAELAPPPPDDMTGQAFGSSVAMTKTDLLVGAEGNSALPGAAFVFVRSP